MKKQTKIKKCQKITGYLGLFLASIVLLVFIMPANAYNCKPGDSECEKAKANMEAKRSEANLFSKKANSISEIIDQLNAEISALDKSIADNEAKIEKLNKKIAETEEKLQDTQEALAEMLINIHFSDDSEPIRVLAGSRSISDYAERAAREEVAKQEIAMMSEKVKKMKDDLNNQKAEVEEALRISENEKVVVASKRESQQVLKANYEKSADDASAVAKYWEDQVRAMAWTPPSTAGSGRRSYDLRNTYPYANNCWEGYVYEGANIAYPYGGLICQCTDYVKWKAYEKFGVTEKWGGDAWMYIYEGGNYVPNNGRTTYVNSVPAPNTIAIWPATWQNPYGHVQWVESINADGTMNITEYNVNWPEAGCYMKDFCARNGHGTAGASFLHFE